MDPTYRRTFRVYVTPAEELPAPWRNEMDEMWRVIIGPFEWEARDGVWNTIRHPDGDFSFPDAHTRVMLNSLVNSQVALDEALAAADREMGDPHP